jgi:PAS domain S-box-containing protein
MGTGHDSPAPAEAGSLAAQVIDLRQTVDVLREGIQVLSPEWRYLYLNRSAAEHGRSTLETLLGRSMLECYPGIEKTHMFAVLERCMRERSAAQLENEFEYPDGQRAWFELRIQACPQGLVVLSLDVTERKRLEANLRQGEKLRALGQLAAGIAHDLKNIFNPIALSARLIQQRMRGDDEIVPLVDRIQQAANVGADAVERLRSFSRHDVEREAEPIDLRRNADAALDLCASRLAQVPALQVRRIHEPAPPVYARGAELVTALVNLLVNAVEATSGSGTITVRTYAAEGGGVIEISDDGPGIPPEIESHMFEPFVTTKADGTGLGLAMVYSFVQRHQGRITVDTAAGRGTCVRLWLPPCDAAAPRVAGVNARQRGARRLLLVEDEAIARLALEMLLSDEGFTVHAVASGEEAIASLDSFALELLLVDLKLPGIDGAAVARKARALNPTVPIVVMSGWDDSSLPLQELRCVRIAKPINFDRLLILINELLSPPGASALELAPQSNR